MLRSSTTSVSQFECGLRRRAARAASTIRSTTIWIGSSLRRYHDFKFGKGLAQVTVTTLLRLADAPLLPFEFGRFAATVTGM